MGFHTESPNTEKFTITIKYIYSYEGMKKVLGLHDWVELEADNMELTV